MSQVSVTINFEAKDAKDAQKQIEGWGLPEGAKVFASIAEPVGPEGLGAVEIDAEGKMQVPEPPEPEPE